LVDENGRGVGGYEVRENVTVIDQEGNIEPNTTSGFVSTSSAGSFTDTIGVPPPNEVQEGEKASVTAEQTFTVRGPDGEEFDLDTTFVHEIEIDGDAVYEDQVKVTTTER